MQYSQEHLKTMVYAEFGGQTECIMGNSKIENSTKRFHMSQGTNLMWSFMSPTTRRTNDHESICRPHFLGTCKHCLSH